MRKKRITVQRSSLSPFTASAIIQLMAEFNRKEDIPQCLTLAKAFKDKAKRLKQEPCRQPSKAKKRSEADKLKRAEAFAKLKAGTYTPVAASLAEAAADRQEYRQEYQPPPVLVKSVAEIAADQARAIDREIGRERNEAWVQDDYDSAPVTAPACPTAAWTPPQTYKRAESGYDIAWRRQDAAREAQEAAALAQEAPQPDRPVTPAASQRPPQKNEPGYLTWLVTEIERRKRAGTWKPE